MKVVLSAGLVVGTLDMLAAFLHYFLKTHNNPIVVLHFIASGVFGDRAYSGGLSMALWGLLFHFIIAFAFTVLFFLLYRSSRFIQRLGILFSVIYGAFMWSVTQFIVIPLSHISSVAPLSFTGVVLPLVF